MLGLVALVPKIYNFKCIKATRSHVLYSLGIHIDRVQHKAVVGLLVSYRNTRAQQCRLTQQTVRLPICHACRYEAIALLPLF